MLVDKNVIENDIENLYNLVVKSAFSRYVMLKWNQAISMLLISLFMILFLVFLFITPSDFSNKTLLSLTIMCGIFAFLASINFTIVRIYQKKYLKMLKNKFEVTNLISVYQKQLDQLNQNIKIIDILTKWTTPPLPFISPTTAFAANEPIILASVNDKEFNLGSISQVSYQSNIQTTENIHLRAQNLNFYRYLYLTFSCASNEVEFSLIRKANINNRLVHSIDKFYQYTDKSSSLTQELQSKILELIQETHLIPNIEVKNQIVAINLDTIRQNSWDDTDNSFFNFQIALDRKTTIENITNQIEKDCSLIQRTIKWVSIIDSLDQI